MLKTVFSDEKTQKILSVMPDLMTAWKIVLKSDNCWSPFVYRSWEYGSGLLKSNDGEFHFVARKEHTCQWMFEILNKWKVRCVHAEARKGLIFFISCLIKKEKIVKIGHDETGNLLTIVTSEAIFPAYPTRNVWESIEKGEIDLPPEYKTASAPDAGQVLADNRMEELLAV